MTATEQILSDMMRCDVIHDEDAGHVAVCTVRIDVLMYALFDAVPCFPLSPS